MAAQHHMVYLAVRVAAGGELSQNLSYDPDGDAEVCLLNLVDPIALAACPHLLGGGLGEQNVTLWVGEGRAPR